MPRPDVVYVERHKNIRQTLSLFLRSGYSRIPVVDENLDDIVGMAYLKDLVRRDFEAPEVEFTQRVDEVMRPVHYVPESKPVDALLPSCRPAASTSRSSSTSTAAPPGSSRSRTCSRRSSARSPTSTTTRRSRSSTSTTAPSGCRRATRSTTSTSWSASTVEDDDVDSVGGLMAKHLGKVPDPRLGRGVPRPAARGRAGHRAPQQDRDRAGDGARRRRRRRRGTRAGQAPPAADHDVLPAHPSRRPRRRSAASASRAASSSAMRVGLVGQAAVGHEGRAVVVAEVGRGTTVGPAKRSTSMWSRVKARSSTRSPKSSRTWSSRPHSGGGCTPAGGGGTKSRMVAKSRADEPLRGPADHPDPPARAAPRAAARRPPPGGAARTSRRPCSARRRTTRRAERQRLGVGELPVDVEASGVLERCRPRSSSGSGRRRRRPAPARAAGTAALPVPAATSSTRSPGADVERRRPGGGRASGITSAATAVVVARRPHRPVRCSSAASSVRGSLLRSGWSWRPSRAVRGGAWTLGSAEPDRQRHDLY